MATGYVTGRLLLQLQHGPRGGGGGNGSNGGKWECLDSSQPSGYAQPVSRSTIPCTLKRSLVDPVPQNRLRAFSPQRPPTIDHHYGKPSPPSNARSQLNSSNDISPTPTDHNRNRIHRQSPAATMEARAIQIVQATEPHTFVLDEEALSDILLQDHLRDRFVSVVSVAGAFRKGKSFILDFFLRYLYAKYHHHNLSSGAALHDPSGESLEWLGEESAPLHGFSWRGGMERETTGILMWSDIFVHDYANGQKVAIILLDTQGTFDSQSTIRDCATIFALSTMLSSVQIFNISQNIQEDDLLHLQTFSEYGRLALASSGDKPFQRLQFLIRDWSYPYEAEYGAVGGQKLLQKRLEPTENQHPDLQMLRRNIASYFEEIACFLMPHPGLSVATNPDFDGRLSEISAEFKQSLRSLVPMLLAPENLIVKQIVGQKVRVPEMIQYFKAYITLYKGDEIPEPKSMLKATAEANNLTAAQAAKELYLQLMTEVCGGTRPYLSVGHLEAEHMRVREKALNQFSTTRKFGGDEYSAEYLKDLEEFVEEQFGRFRESNETKNIFKAARTPTVFFCIAIIMYILSGVFGLFGMYTFANFANLVMGVSLLTLAVWGYIRYSGEFSDFGCQIDWLASVIWENLLKPIYEGCIEKGAQHVAIQATQAAIGAQSGRGNSRTGAATHSANGKLKSS